MKSLTESIKEKPLPLNKVTNLNYSVKDITNELQAQNLEGKKVSVTGEIQPGRFIVRKKKGNQDGYAILAPYIVEAQWNS